MAATIVPKNSSDRSPAAAGAGASPRPRLVVLEGGRSRAGLVSSYSRRPARLPATVYRRRRLTVLALIALPVLFATASRLDGGASVPSSPAPEPIAATADDVYVVQPGDTLWAIARRVRPDGDVRAVVDHLIAVHGSVTVRAGDRIPLQDFAPPP